MEEQEGVKETKKVWGLSDDPTWRVRPNKGSPPKFNGSAVRRGVTVVMATTSSKAEKNILWANYIILFSIHYPSHL